ncbi:MAG: esterase-like activity of phytase family protein [Rhodovibrionaceae bacterium]
MRLPILLLCLLALPAAAEPIPLTAVGKQLNAEDLQQTRIGKLDWRGTLELGSADSRFGGYSGLLIGADGLDLTAVSDLGHWLSGRLTYDGAGRLTSFTGAEIRPLLGEDGQPLHGKAEGDAEALTRDEQGRLLVSFERDHRILAYDDLGSAGVLLPAPPIHPKDGNAGLEALETLPSGGGLLALTESGEAEGGGAFLWRDGSWHPLGYRRTRNLSAVGATATPDGTVYLVERSWSLVGGLELRIARLRAAEIQPGAELRPEELAVLRPPLMVDNFEGIAARRTPQGETLLYLLSDDNLNPVQRSLLSVFAVE